MSIWNLAARRTAAPQRGRDHRVPLASLPRGRRNLRPMAEDLEGRTLLSVGLDPTYGFGGVSVLNAPTNNKGANYTQTFNAIALQNGQVVEAGSLTTNPTASGSTSTGNLIVARLTTSGFLDPSFGAGGIATIPVSSGGGTYNVSAVDIAVQSDGKIDVLGEATPSSSSSGSEFVVARLNSNGSIDTSFGTSGFRLINVNPTSKLSFATALAIGPNGQIVAVGDTVTSSGEVFVVTQLTAGGALDTSFNSTGIQTVSFPIGASAGAIDDANAVVVQPDGKIVAVGTVDFPATGGASRAPSYVAVARLNPDGTPDTSFGTNGQVTLNDKLGGGLSSDFGNAVTLSGTQIVIAGESDQDFPTQSGQFTPTNNELTVTRLNANGSLDTTFGTNGTFALALTQSGTIFNTRATSIVAGPSGALLVGGSASEQQPVPAGSSSYSSGGPGGGLLVSLTPTGALDSSFGNNGAAIIPETVDSHLLMQTDGKLVFLSGSDVVRTTGPAPSPATTAIVTMGTAKDPKATGVTITFNTAVNPTLLTNPSLYQVRLIKGGKVRKQLIKLKKQGGVSYNATTHTLTLTFASKMALAKNVTGFQVVITTGGIVGEDGQVLPSTPIIINKTR